MEASSTIGGTFENKRYKDIGCSVQRGVGLEGIVALGFMLQDLGCATRWGLLKIGDPNIAP